MGSGRPRPELQRRQGHVEAAAVHRLGHPHADAVRAGLHRRQLLLHAVALGGADLRPQRRQQHGDRHLHRGHRPLRTDQRHRQLRLERGPAVGPVGLPGRRHQPVVGDPRGQPVLAHLRGPGARHHQQRPEPDGDQHRFRRRLDRLGQRLGRLLADQHLRQLPGRRRRLHGRGEVRPDRVRHPHRHPDHHQQRDRQPHHRGPHRHRNRHGQHQPGGRPADQRVQPHRRLPVLEPHRRQPGQLLGERQQRLPAVGAGRPGLRPERRQGRPAAAGRLGLAQRDAVGHRKYRRQQLQHPQAVRVLRLHAGREQHRHDHLHRGHRALRPGDGHRQRRLARGPAVRTAGVELLKRA
ncbi:hypothetical protein SBRY_30925 [Actinacidiphila bryophytorum]|uniref:Uncharacterized protein n=1 Tax=Actinacidiphila bryophytorum TaxID=1436133 RepID=A0A9W4H1W1_9ACTN|nr:hypothetical protein SBRY_30925 [Actinacidiphila bryophytorum]